MGKSTGHQKTMPFLIIQDIISEYEEKSLKLMVSHFMVYK